MDMNAMMIGRRPKPSDSGPQISCARAKPAKYIDNVSLTVECVVPKTWTISGIAGVNKASEIGPTATIRAPRRLTRRSLMAGARGLEYAFMLLTFLWSIPGAFQ